MQTKQGDGYICWRKWQGVPIFRIYSLSPRVMGSYSQAFFGRICKGRWKFLENSKRHLPKLQHWPVLWKQVKWRCVASQRDQKAQSVVNTAGGLVLAVSLHPSNLRYLGQPPPDTLLCPGSYVSLNSSAPWGNSLASENSSKGRRMRRIWLLPAVIRKSSNYSALLNVRGRKEHVNRASFDLSLPKLLPLRYVTYLPWAQDSCNN